MTRSRLLRLVLLPVAGLLAACAAGRDPAPLTGTLSAPGLAGQRVMVFPVQEAPSPREATRELVFALESRGGTSRWVFPDALRSSLERSPGLDVPLDELPVGVFRRAEVRRIGDPLYGMIRRAASLNGATAALLPVAVGFRPAGAEEPAAMEVLAAVVDVTTGRVLWLDGDSAPADGPGDPGGLARVMDALARRLLPEVQGSNAK